MDRQWSVEELAGSAFKVFSRLMGESDAWEGLSLDRMAPWLHVAQQAEGVLRSMDGCSYAQCGKELMRLMMPPEERVGALALWNNLSERAKLAWEAVARHLWMLNDSDEVASLEQAEALWGNEWAEAASKKRAKERAIA